MFETYRMLGGEREAELLREAQRLHALPSRRLHARFAQALSLAQRLVVRFPGGTARVRATSAGDSEPAVTRP